ncbi:pachytene checkpoint protein 2 homolog [Lolium rigidum]|uniref:pachytene checkpoint protein 2 homolog n=1 Tax=Lolium rigidum TaxID=89674 RepID=UPI001F5CE0D5|nr:pachytene checkpoint protein 2 homolog [Lolium rigidum]
MEISFDPFPPPPPPPPPTPAPTPAVPPFPASPPLDPAVDATAAAVPSSPQPTTVVVAAPTPPDDKVLVSVEVLLHAASTARAEEVRAAVERMLETRSLSYVDGPVSIPADNHFLLKHVKRIQICDTDEWIENHKVLLFWQVKPVVHVFQLSEDGPGEEPSEDDTLSSFNEWALPAKEFDGLWESLLYEVGLKQRLLRYAASALLFTERGVDPCLVSWNRIVLLHGPPGTGKTSLCKALAQKLSIRFKSRYSMCQLVEVNAHSLFSKWFSESGKLVAKLFQKIQEMVEEESNLVFVLIDEVESLAAARQAAISGSEPSDSIRVVNALLTQMDKLKAWPNVIILTTSNITTAIDIAFVDRADIKAYVGPPTLQARYEILRSCIQELFRVGILASPQGGDLPSILSYSTLKEKLHCPEAAEPHTLHLSELLHQGAEQCEGLSGRSLRKLPFLAHASVPNPSCCDATSFMHTLVQTARRELLESRG